MNCPNKYYADQLREQNEAAQIGGKWVSARPLGFQGLCLSLRFKHAWNVFTGKADALYWHGQ